MSLVRRHPARSEERMNIDAIGALAKASSASYRTAGVSVNDDSAMRHDAVWACTTRIAQDVSMMPADVVRYVNGTRVPVEPTPALIAAPSVQISGLDWRYQVMISLLRAGNAWGVVTATTANGVYPTRIELLATDQVTITDNRIYIDNEERFLFPIGDIWHLAAYTMPGSWVGLSPIAYHARTIGLGLAAEAFGESFFADGGHPNAIVGIDGTPTEEQATSLKDKLMSITRGNRELIVMPKTTTYTPLSVNPDDSAFIDSQRYTVEQICRIYGEDPADYGASAGSSGSLTYANRSDADLARFKRRQFWVTKLQDALTALLPRPQVVKLNTSSVLMMTDKERHEIHAMRLQSYTTTVNEVRKVEDDPPFGPEFDEPGLPAPMNESIVDVEAARSESFELVGQILDRWSVEARTTPVIEARSVDESRVQSHETHIHLPDSLQLEMRQDPIVIPAPVVNVPPAQVTVNVEPTPVTVNVAAPSIELPPPVVNVDGPVVNVPAPLVTVVNQKSSAKVIRDGKGNITKIVSEES